MTKAFLAGATALAILAGCATPMSAAQTPATMKNGSLVSEKGMSLYTFDRDVAGTGKSACNGDCAMNWPPYLAVGGRSTGDYGPAAAPTPTGDFTIVVRDDGGKQWAYKGKPLYTWRSDQKPGDRTGDNFLNVWHVAK